jgi:predicted nucleic acid-binding protein
MKSYWDSSALVETHLDGALHDRLKAEGAFTRSLGVRGGRVHDFIHAMAAQKSGATTLLTMDKNDFTGLTSSVAVEQV